ncbi:MAG: acetate kinase [Clostridia bacterium]|jgi:acetate kinase|nr:acetate kinase [Clostridia bacterium]
MKILVVNAGSSSLKYQLFDMESGDILAKGICERIAIDGKITHKLPDGRKIEMDLDMPNHAVATKILVDTLTNADYGCIKDMSEIEAVGHRVVHGGPYFFESSLVTPEVMEKLRQCVDFAPLHTPAHLMGIDGCTAVMPNVPQVLVFDTAFHTTQPKKASTYAIKYEDAEEYQIRRYGAHGTSHRFVSAEMAKLLDKPVEETKIITCHIGNGSSISAVKGGKCVDTSMGFTPLDGVEMGTRCGSIDPAIVPYLMKKKNFTPDQVASYMNKECGFLGVSGISSDSRDIEAAILENDGIRSERAALAANVLAYQIQKYIGSYTAAMNGLDAIVFTAGMGENNTELRERVCTDMEFFGIELDKEANAKAHHQSNIVKLSTDNSKVAVWLIPTNEELMIARDTEEIVKAL